MSCREAGSAVHCNPRGKALNVPMLISKLVLELSMRNNDEFIQSKLLIL